MKQLKTLIQAMPKGYRTDSAQERARRSYMVSSGLDGSYIKGRRVDLELLARCRQAWEDKRDVRETRQRVMNYCYGDQWGDIINVNGKEVTEREYLRMQNTVPLVNNIMISVLNSVVGLYAKQSTEPVCFARTRDAQELSDMMSATMQANWQDTKMPLVLKHIFEDGLCGGMHFAREAYEEREQELDSYTDYCNPNFAFWEGGSDPRHQDFSLIGLLNDVSPEDLFFKFAKPEYGLTVDDLKHIYNLDDDFTHRRGGYSYHSYNATGELMQNEQNDLANISFEVPANRRNVRVIEVWSKETKLRYQCEDPIATNANDARFRVNKEDLQYIIDINEQRRRQYDEQGVPEEIRAYISAKPFVDAYWYFTYMAPDGTVLCEGESPYDFHSHPFSVSLFPYVNGEIHPFMGNIIDQQRYVNRLIVMHDIATRSSAKGLTIVPMSAIPDDMTPEDFADQFTSYDGLIFYETSRLNPNLRPEVITSNAVQIGTYELLQLQMGLVRDISNVSGALQGKTPSAGTSADRYAQEAQNATTSLFSVLSDFTAFTEAIARKKCSNIKQFYPDGKIISNLDNTGVIEYNRMATRDVMYKISIKEATATASYQQQMNDLVMQLFNMQAINVKQMLQNINAPFADRLLQQIESEEARQQAMLELQQQQQAMSPEQRQQADANTEKVQQMLRQ